MVKAVTRRNKARRANKSRRSGGGGKLVAVLGSVRVVPNKDHYQRMIDNESDSINASKSHIGFYMDQMEAAKRVPENQTEFMSTLIKKVYKGEISAMDMESATAMTVERLFFDKDDNVVLVMPQ
jgi:uridine phosphorylase